MSETTSRNDEPVPHILVIGSLNIDLVTLTPRVPHGGETLTASSFATHPGGKGANQAVACARASRHKPQDDNDSQSTASPEIVHVSMVGAVGRDTYADLLLDTLKRNGVKCDQVLQVDSTTGVAVILVEEDSGQNRILITPGANGLMQPSLIPSLTAQVKPDLIVLQLEIPIDTVLEILRRARQAGIDVLLNPAPAVQLPDEALRDLAYLVLNETEAGMLCDLQPPSESEDMTPFLNQAFAKLSARGVRHPIVTLGSRGVAFQESLTGGKPSWKVIQAHRVSKVVDTTAAGDSFVGYFGVGLVQAKRRGDTAVENWSPAEVVGHANLAAARTVTKAGAMDSIPFMNELS